MIMFNLLILIYIVIYINKTNKNFIKKCHYVKSKGFKINIWKKSKIKELVIIFKYDKKI